MRAFCFALLCVVVAVQGRSFNAGPLTAGPAAAGENPWIVHIRVATGSGQGLLRSCVGALISPSWVLTSARCVDDHRFIWIRYGAVDVIRPDYVSESTSVTLNPDFDRETGANDVGLINLNRVVEFTDNISSIDLISGDDEIPAEGKFCAYGAYEGVPGEQLNCFDVSLEESEDGSIAATSDDGEATEFDLGAPVVSEGVQVGILSRVGDGSAVFLNPSKYSAWISQVTGI